MNRILYSVATALVGVGAWAAFTSAAPVGPPAPVPHGLHGLAVVELFQSQGCSDCPPAQDYLNTLADRPDVLALSYGVTYWDYLGWKDSFASPQYTQRQRDYAAHNGQGNIATPQYWINGRETVLGANPGRVAQLIAQGAEDGPTLGIQNDHVSIGAGRAPPGGADIWLVHYDPRIVDVAISAGENGGRTLPHRDIVRDMTKVGHWSGTPVTLSLAAPRVAAWNTAILVQAGPGGPILAAARG
jgi:hypothetical protein